MLLQKTAPDQVTAGMRSVLWLELLAHVAVYCEASIRDHNCKFGSKWGPDGGVVYPVIADADIAAGSELLCSYGAGYWMYRSRELTSNVLTSPTWSHELAKASVDMTLSRHSVLETQPPGCTILSYVVAYLTSLDAFVERRSKNQFVDFGAELMASMATAPLVDGRSPFTVDGYMAEFMQLADPLRR